MASRKQVQELADRLISTLSSSMDSDQADAIVRDVAESLYREVLGIPGHIRPDTKKPMGWAHIGGAKGVKKQRVTIADYIFVPDSVHLPDDRRAIQ